MYKFLILFLTLSSVLFVEAQRRPKQQRFRQQQTQDYSTDYGTTPVPILRQINTHNDDGSYTYGYEGADGSYKVETKAANGEVKGKYGYYDDVGQLREIEYGATRNGFVPSGTGINVPPPAPISSSSSVDYDDDGQYRPELYEAPYQYQQSAPIRDNANYITPRGRSVGRSGSSRFRQQQQQEPQQIQRPIYQQQQYNNNNDDYYSQEIQYSQPQPQYNQQQQYSSRNFNSPSFPTFQQSQTRFHPSIPNLDLSTGSYSIKY